MVRGLRSLGRDNDTAYEEFEAMSAKRMPLELLLLIAPDVPVLAASDVLYRNDCLTISRIERLSPGIQPKHLKTAVSLVESSEISATVPESQWVHGSVMPFSPGINKGLRAMSREFLGGVSQVKKRGQKVIGLKSFQMTVWTRFNPF